MKLYQDPTSTTSRPILLFLADHHVPVELVPVSLMAGEQHAPDFVALNPNAQVPVLVDDALVLTESAAILRYLAAKIGSPTWPDELADRARVDSAIEWFNTGFNREFGYHFVYAELFDHVGLPGAANNLLRAAGRGKATRMFDILETHWLRDDYLCGPQLSIADYFGVSFVSLADWVGFDLSPWPRTQAWIARMRARPACASNWAQFDSFTAMLRQRLAATG